MSAVLEKWKVAKISDFAKTTSGGTPSRKNPTYYTGEIPWIKSGDLNDGNVSEAREFITKEALKSSSAKLFPSGTLMIALYGATIGKLGILTIEAATNQAVCGIFVPEEVETKYLFYFLLHHRRDLIKQGAGGAQPNISQGIVRDVKIPLPPLPEQRRIVARIEELFSRLDAGVAALRQAKTQLQRYRQSVLAAAVTGQLTREWREQHPDTESAEELLKRILKQRREQWNGRGKYQEPFAPEDSELPALPRGWTWAVMEQLGLVIGGLTKNSKRNSLLVKLPYLRVANVYANELRLEDVKEIGVAKTELEKLLVRKGDLLIVEGNGSKDQIGRLAIWDGSIDPCVHQNHLIKVRLIEPKLGKFVLTWMLSPSGRPHIERVASSTSGLYTLSVGKVANLPIPLPPIAEQHQIVAEVEARTTAIDHLEAELDRQITRSNRMRQSILRSAFSGRLNHETK